MDRSISAALEPPPCVARGTPLALQAAHRLFDCSVKGVKVMAPLAYLIAASTFAFCALCALTLVTMAKHFDPPDVRSWPLQY